MGYQLRLAIGRPSQQLAQRACRLPCYQLPAWCSNICCAMACQVSTEDLAPIAVQITIVIRTEALAQQFACTAGHAQLPEPVMTGGHWSDGIIISTQGLA